MNLGYGYGMYYFDYSYIFVIIGMITTYVTINKKSKEYYE